MLRRVEITEDLYFLQDLLQIQQAFFIPAMMQQHPASILHLMFSSLSPLPQALNMKIICRR